MANVIKTVITYPLNGSTRDFNIPFEYLARKFVQVTLIGRDRKPLTNIDDYRFTSKNQITTNRAWGTGDGYQLIELRRFTSATERLVDFSDGSILRAYDLNVSQIQTLHVAEEARDLTADTIGVNSDGDLDARGRRIVNLADPVNDLDAVNLKTVKSWNDGAYQSYIKAKEQAEYSWSQAQESAKSAAAAKVSETNAKESERNALTYSNRANSDAKAAAASASSASGSASSASSSAQEATAAKAYTKQQADRSYNEAERAKGYADSMGNIIDIGKVISEIDTQTNKVTWKGTQQAAGNYVTTGLNYQIRPMGATFNGLAVEMGINVGATQPHYAWKKTESSPWTLLYYPSENGTFASREWVNKMVYTPNDSTTRLQSPNGRYTVQLENRGTWGFKDTVSDSYRMAFDSEGIATFYGASLTIRGINHYTGINLYRSDSSRIRLEMKPETQMHCLEIPMYNASGSHLRTLGLPNSDGTVATREWVKENSQLGEEWRYYVSQGEDMDKVWNLMAAIARVPKNAVFTRLERDNQWTCRFYCRTLRYAS